MKRNKLFFRNWRLEKILKKTPTISLNIFYIKDREICPAYISKTNRIVKNKWFSNDPKQRKKLALSYNKNIIYTNTLNNLKL